MRKQRRPFIGAIIVAVLLAIVLTGCSSTGSSGGDTPLPEANPRGDRRIGYDILDTTETGSFDDNLAQAIDMEMEFLNFLVWWNQIETGEGSYDGEFAEHLALLELVAEANPIKLSLIISPIDIPGRGTPAYLSETKFNEPEMATRFEALLDFVVTKISPDNLVSISVGNEIDAYNWEGNGDTPGEYKVFLQSISDHEVFTVHGVNLAFTGTVDGINNSDTPEVWTDMRSVVDVLHATYYPLQPGYFVREPDTVHQDLADFVAMFEGPIFLQEVGYQTSAVNGSSESKQAQFFREFFVAWDRHRDVIPQASILRFVDLSEEAAQNAAEVYGLGADEGFKEYLRTLGIRTHAGTGTDKAAVATIKAELEARGW